MSQNNLKGTTGIFGVKVNEEEFAGFFISFSPGIFEKFINILLRHLNNA